MYCSHCEKDMPTNFIFCPVCGNAPTLQSQPTRQPLPQQTNYYQNNPPITVQPKSEALAIVLSVLILGVGQMYLGKVGRGIGILVGGIILGVIGIATYGIGFIAAIILFIWQVIDSYNLCRRYNSYLLQNGRPPW